MSILSPTVRGTDRLTRATVALAAPTAVVPPPSLDAVGTTITAMTAATTTTADAAGPQLDRARFLARALLLDGGPDRFDVSRVEADVDELVSVWTPTLCAESRLELVSALVEADDTIRDVVVTFHSAATTTSTVFLEWVATGRFAGPAFLHDDVLVEPTGAVVRAAGALAASFQSGRATRLRCYFDRLAVLEQLLDVPRFARSG